MNKKPIIWYRISYLIVKLYSSLSIIVSLKTWLFIGKCFGYFFYVVDIYHRNIALKNLRFAFGNEKKENEIRKIARKNFQQFSMSTHECLRLNNVSLEEINNLVYVEGKEHLIAAKKKNQSVILLGAHFGNWEYAHSFYSSTINHLNFIVRKVDNPFIEQERINWNKQAGVNIIDKRHGLRLVIKRLKKGEDVVIFADQKGRLKDDFPCQFFGKKTSTMTIVPALARKFHIPIVPMFIVRCDDGVHHRILFFPELEVGYDEEKQGIDEATQRQSDIIEKVVREYPDHWLWFHKRWKRYHMYLYPEEVVRRRRRRAKRKRKSRLRKI